MKQQLEVSKLTVAEAKVLFEKNSGPRTLMYSSVSKRYCAVGAVLHALGVPTSLLRGQTYPSLGITFNGYSNGDTRADWNAFIASVRKHGPWGKFKRIVAQRVADKKAGLI